MRYLLDTCIISELIKKSPHKNVLTWIETQDEENLFLSVITIGEIEKGIVKLLEPDRKRKLEIFLSKDILERFGDRLLSVHVNVAKKWGEILGVCERGGTPIPVVDALIAATAFVYDCTVVTRDTKDMKKSKVEILDPWTL
jgi:hypothetical protein